MRDVPAEAVDACLRHFASADVGFISRKEFGYSWQVSGRGIVLRISDYLSEAPDPVVPEFCDMVCRRVLGRGCAEPPSYLSYVRSAGYITRWRPVYISRSRNLIRSSTGECRELTDSVQRLLDDGLLHDSDIDNSFISWTRRDSFRRVGFCSPMFRVVGVSSILDSEAVPDSVRDYVVYHECLHLRQGYLPGSRAHSTEFRAWERAYPGWQEAERFLRSLGPRTGASR